MEKWLWKGRNKRWTVELVEVTRRKGGEGGKGGLRVGREIGRVDERVVRRTGWMWRSSLRQGRRERFTG